MNESSPDSTGDTAAVAATAPDHLQVTIIGCSGTYSSAESACSAYLIRSPGATVLLDAGAGSSRELQNHVRLEDVDAIVVSHEHPDHWTELPILYHAYRFGLQRFHVPTYGTSGTKKLLDACCSEATEHAFDWSVIDESSELTIGDQTWNFSETDHPVETLAARVEVEGNSLAYSADTGPDWSPESFAKPIGLMVYEASLPIDLEDCGIPHVSGRQVAERATAAAIESLVLTHVPPGHDHQERLSATLADFTGSVELAVPGATFAAR